MALTDASGQRFEADARVIGGRGPVRITGTSAVTGNFYRIVPEAGGATLSAMVGLGSTSWSGCAIPVDGIWSGAGRVITSVTLTSGAAIAYQI